MEANLRITGAPVSLLEVAIVLPSQHFQLRHKQKPEYRLMIAVLQDAVECVEKYRSATERRGRRLFREARQWFLADESDWPYSFECLCGALDLDANAVRHHLGVALEDQPGSLPPSRARHESLVTVPPPPISHGQRLAGPAVRTHLQMG